jgi:hypothetical protein
MTVYTRHSEALAYNGMSLRDYFAIHGDQPGVLEIASAAGLRSEDNFWVIGADGKKQKFNDWYHALSQHERFELQAKVRYQLADAMMKHRGKP